MNLRQDDSTIEQPWHALHAGDALERVQSESRGLSSEEASRRLEEYGENRIEQGRRSTAWERLKRQLTSILIIILIISAFLAAFVGAWLDSAVILAVVLVNTLIGFVQEGKAERAIESIQKMLSPKARVIRDGEKEEIDAIGLVPGDIVVIASGDRIPADLRLFEADSLGADEAVLTGESVASTKQTEPVEEEAELGDRTCLAYSGTVVTSGEGKGVVIATGERTEVGRISSMLAHVEKLRTPLLRQVDQFGRLLSVVILAVSALTFVIGYLLRDYGLLETFLAALSLAVAAIPEGLPAIMTITLAIGVRRMASRKAIVRRLPAVETLGSVTVICSDKTGTLTRNEMTLKTVATHDDEYEIEGVGYVPKGRFLRNGNHVPPHEQHGLLRLLRAALLCNNAVLRWKEGQWFIEGDPTEGALVVAAVKAGLDRSKESVEHPRKGVIPFDSKHKFMATLHGSSDGEGLIFIKGAPDTLIELCEWEQRGNDVAPLDARSWRARVESIAGRGQRTLAIGYRKIREKRTKLSFSDLENDLVLIGIVGMIDPPRAEAIEAVDACHSAGISVKMITGDHAITAEAVARQMHISSGNGVMIGREIERASDRDLERDADEIDVFARSSPEHKLRLVQALQSRGQVVAMTGDGVNDAPSLKQANIGIAMGLKGTDAAREVAEMVLADDNFASIASAVEEGRGVYDNLRKTLIFILPTNGGQALTIVAGIALGLALPLRPVHVLWVNMVVAVTLALALAFEPIERDVMQRKPRRPDTPLITPFLLWRIGFMSLLLLIGTLGHFLWELEVSGRGVDYARTAAINTLVAGQIFYLFNSRYILRSTFNLEGILGSRAAWVAVLVLVLLQAAFNFLEPMQAVFGTVTLQSDAWVRILIFGVLVYLFVEFEKLILRRKA